MNRTFKEILTVAIVASVVVLAQPARADRSIIKNPGEHASYAFEAEPHALLGLWGVPGPGGGTGIGVGFRGSIPIVANGFVSSINNNVAISFGLDWVHYDVDDWCLRYWRGPTVCGYDDEFSIVWLPVAMQWNFFIQRELMNDLSVDIGYVGSSSRKQIGYSPFNNAIKPGPGPIDPRRLLPQFGDLDGGSNQEFTDLVCGRGGRLFICHLEERMDWQLEGITGTEIYNTHADFKDEADLLKAFRDPLWLFRTAPLFRQYPQAAYSALLDRPADCQIAS